MKFASRVSLALMLTTVFVALSGCAGNQYFKLPWEKPAPVLSTALEPLDVWTIRGRIGVKIAKEGWSAGIDWRQQGGAFDIKIRAPLGQGSVRLSGDEQRVRLDDDEGKSHYADHVESLMQEHLGWQLPLDGVRHWITGLADPGVPLEVQTKREDGLFNDLTQRGWAVSFERYSKDPSLRRPTKLSMTYEDVRVRLVISKWDIPPN